MCRDGAVAVLSLVLVAQPALAGDRGHGHYRHYDRHYGHGHHYDRHYRHGHHYKHKHKRRGDNDEIAYLLGGLVVGSVLTHVLTAPSRQAAPQSYYAPAYTPAPRTTTVTSGRRLFRDIDGNCFERHVDGRGREVLSALPAWECDW